jgi:hypothetical protein
MQCNMSANQFRAVGWGSMLRSGTGGTLALEGNERWFLVHTLPHNERRAELHLGAQGFRTHFPTIEKTIRHARQLRTVRAPLFPRYIFLILDLGRDRWLSVGSPLAFPRSTPARIVRCPCRRALWKL